MKIFRFEITPEAVVKQQQDGNAFLRVSNPCPCGCSPKPFVSISNGETGVTAQFETVEELARFKQQVNELRLSEGDEAEKLSFKDWFQQYGNELLKGWLRARQDNNTELFAEWVLGEYDHYCDDEYEDYEIPYHGICDNISEIELMLIRAKGQ